MCLQSHGQNDAVAALNVASLLGTGVSMMQPSTWGVVGNASG